MDAYRVGTLSKCDKRYFLSGETSQAIVSANADSRDERQLLALWKLLFHFSDWISMGKKLAEFI